MVLDCKKNIRRAETRRQSITLFNLNWEHTRWVTQNFPNLDMSTNDHESGKRINLGGNGITK